MEPQVEEILDTPIESITKVDISATQVLDTPIEKKKTFKLLGFRVSVLNLQLGQLVRLSIYLNCVRGEEHYIEYRELVIEGDDYAAWGYDDNYIMEFVNSKLSSLF